jgi:hypothetical protein
LDPQAHCDVKIALDKTQAVSEILNMVPVVLSEFANLVVQFPILFSKSTETGQFVCVALMGLEKGHNLFWRNNQFDSIYLPLNITRQPFFAGQADNHTDEHVIVIDLDNPAIAKKGEALFSTEGKATPYLKQMQSQLYLLAEGQYETSTFIEKIIEFDLLVSLKLDITYENGHKHTVNGLYSIDEEKLSELLDEQLLDLQHSGYMRLIHTQLASLGQIYALIDKKNKLN